MNYIDIVLIIIIAILIGTVIAFMFKHRGSSHCAGCKGCEFSNKCNKK